MTLSLPAQFVNFAIAWAGSWKIGATFPKAVGMPMIVGYMAVGFCCGKYVTGMLSPETLNPANPLSVVALVNNLTLSFIAFSAGSELHIPSLGMAKLKEILVQIFMTGFFMVVLGTPLIMMMKFVMPASVLDTSTGCQWSAAMLVALVQWAGSVIEVLAIYHETHGSGPVTQLMIGTTMLLDMCVLVFFAIGQNIVISACPLEGATMSTVASIVGVSGSILLWAGIGILLGMLLQLYLMLPPMGMLFNALKPILVVVTGGVSYFSLVKVNGFIENNAPESLSLLRIDPLLVCMIGAIWANHVSKHRDGFREILSDMAPLVMPPFFTIAGATLDLEAIMHNMLAPPVLFSLRFLAIALGSAAACQVMKQPKVVRNHLWMTLQSQSGVTLGLVAQMQMGLVGMQPWAKGAAATIIGCVVMNQLVGPTLCRFGIRRAGESNEEDDEMTIHDIAASGREDDVMPPRHGSMGSTRKRMSVAKIGNLNRLRTTSSERPSTGSVLSVPFAMHDDTDLGITKKRCTMVLSDVENVISGKPYDIIDEDNMMIHPFKGPQPDLFEGMMEEGQEGSFSEVVPPAGPRVTFQPTDHSDTSSETSSGTTATTASGRLC